jgi:hypothetical protein
MPAIYKNCCTVSPSLLRHFPAIQQPLILRCITDKFAAHILKMYIGLPIQPSTLGAFMEFPTRSSVKTI